MVSPDESSGLLSSTGGHDNKQKHEEHNEEEEEEAKVTTLELFSDLVVVVAIHIVAEPLEEEGCSILWYLIHVIMLWLVWFGLMQFMNAATVYGRSKCPYHYVIVFVWMGLVLQMTQAFAARQDARAIWIYLATRVIEIAVYIQQTHEAPPPFVSQQRIHNFQSLTIPFLYTTALFEVVPLTVAIWLRDTSETGGGEVYLPAVLVYIITLIGSYTELAIRSDRDGQRMLQDAFDSEHLQERHELVTLIFIGEICFAAGASVGHDWKKIAITTAALILAYAAYLLMFATRDFKGPPQFWTSSAKHLVAAFTLHAPLFCTIPALGSGFVRILNRNEEQKEEEADSSEADSSIDNNLVEEHGYCKSHAANLLCYSTCAFLLVTSLISLLDWHALSPPMRECKGGTEAQNIGLFGRVTFRWTCAVLVLLLVVQELPSWMACIDDIPTATFLCPLLTILCALVEVWGAGTVKPFVPFSLAT